MRQISGFVVAAMIVMGTVSLSQGKDGYPAKDIAGRDALSDLKLLERVLTTVHAGWGRYTTEDEMDAAFSRLRRALRGGTNDEQMYLEISRFLELIRCDHTKAEYPDTLQSWRESNRSFLPVRTHVFNNRLFAGTNRVEGMDSGDEIVSINGVSSSVILKDIRALISIDGSTDHARDDELSLSGEYMGSGLDTFLPLLFGWNESFDFAIRDGDNGDSNVTGQAITFGTYESMVRSGEPVVRDFNEAVSVEQLDDDTAILRVDSFINYRTTVDPDGVFGPIMQKLNRDGVGHLIVDLRRNGGGSDDAAESLFRHLITEPVATEQFALVRTVPIPKDVVDAVTTWDRSLLQAPRSMFEQTENGMWQMLGGGKQRVLPSDDHFEGRITVLSSRGNASGSTMTIAGLQQLAGARVVGEATGGSVEGPTAGVMVFLTLPESGIKVRVPLIRTVTGLMPKEAGMGVTPDVLVEITADGFFSGRDQVLEAALAE